MQAVSDGWRTADTPSGSMRAFRAAADSTDPRPGLVILQEAFGVNDHIQDVCRRFARVGYVALAPDLFHRQSVDVVPYSEIPRAKELIGSLSDGDVLEDVRAAMSLLSEDPAVAADSIGVVGYCFGGRCAFVAATRIPALRATVIYYGGRIASTQPNPPLAAASEIASPILAHFGENDASIPLEDVHALRAALDSTGVDNLVATYPDAGHGFACDARPDHFDPDATEAAWELTTAFLGAAMSGRQQPALAAAAAASPTNRQRWRRA